QAAVAFHPRGDAAPHWRAFARLDLVARGVVLLQIVRVRTRIGLDLGLDVENVLALDAALLARDQIFHGSGGSGLAGGVLALLDGLPGGTTAEGQRRRREQDARQQVS